MAASINHTKQNDPTRVEGFSGTCHGATRLARWVRPNQSLNLVFPGAARMHACWRAYAN